MQLLQNCKLGGAGTYLNAGAKLSLPTRSPVVVAPQPGVPPAADIALAAAVARRGNGGQLGKGAGPQGPQANGDRPLQTTASAVEWHPPLPAAPQSGNCHD